MFSKLTIDQYKMLKKIKPSNDREMDYYPCDVVLNNDEEVSCVYIVNAENYIKYWGIYPKDDKNKKELKIEDVKSIKESKYRIPEKYATKLYATGESGMGYTVFKIIFRKSEQVYHSGNALDFIDYPDELSKKDIKSIVPHVGRNDLSTKKAKEYYWCLYEE